MFRYILFTTIQNIDTRNEFTVAKKGKALHKFLLQKGDKYTGQNKTHTTKENKTLSSDKTEMGEGDS